MIPNLDAIAQLAALRFVDSLLEGACIAAFVALALRFTRRQSSAIRFALCFCALIAITVLPFFRVSSRAASGAGHAAIALPESWALYVLVAWGVVACFGCLRLAIAFARLHRLRKDCVPMDIQSLDPLLQNTLAAQNMNRRFILCTSDRVRVPTAIGLLKPLIVIPRWVVRELSPVELNQILLHELAHLRRWDDWTNLAQQFVKALFFFHPAVWWVEKRIALEREMACDDAVLAATSSPRAYAECLTRLAERSFIRQSVALAQAALGKIRQTSLRVAQILDADRSVNVGSSWKPAAALVAGFAIASGMAISRSPSLIAFQDSRPMPTASTAVPTDTASTLTHAASFKVPANPARTSPVLPAKLRVRPQYANGQPQVLKLKAASRTPLPPAIRLTSSQDNAPPFTERLLFVVEDANGPSGQQVYRIQLWRVIVFYPTDDSIAHAPPKQT